MAKTQFRIKYTKSPRKTGTPDLGFFVVDQTGAEHWLPVVSFEGTHDRMRITIEVVDGDPRAMVDVTPESTKEGV